MAQELTLGLITDARISVSRVGEGEAGRLGAFSSCIFHILLSYLKEYSQQKALRFQSLRISPDACNFSSNLEHCGVTVKAIVRLAGA